MQAAGEVSKDFFAVDMVFRLSWVILNSPHTPLYLIGPPPHQDDVMVVGDVG
jgi:hypothetical protein